MHDIGLRRIAVAHGRHVAHINHCAVDGLDRQVAQFLNSQRRIVELDIVFEVADLLRADRRNEILRGQRLSHVLPRQSQRLKRIGNEIDLNLALLAAERIRDRSARHRDQRGTQLVDAQICEILFGQSVA